jgi:hypothetical protein
MALHGAGAIRDTSEDRLGTNDTVGVIEYILVTTYR